MQYNGKDLSSSEYKDIYKVEKVYPVEMMGYTNKWTNPLGLAARYVGSYLQPYTRKVDIRVLGETEFETSFLKNKLIGILLSDNVSKLKFETEQTYELAKLQSFAVDDYLLGTLKVELTFYCPYGCSFSEEAQFTLANNANTLIAVEGSVDTPPIFSLTTTATTVQVTNQKTSKFIRLVGIPSGTAITINCETLQVLSGIATSYRGLVTLESDFFDLKPGDQEIRLVGATGNVKWNPRWQ